MMSPLTLHDLLDLEDIGSDYFRSRRTEPNLSGALYGGQVLAQALRASQFTVNGRPVHSLHGYFIRPGAEAEPVVYQVERTRDGRNFTTRRVIARQKGVPIFHMEASFHDGAEGVAHAQPAPAVLGADQVSAEDPFERAITAARGADDPTPRTLLPLVERRLVPAEPGAREAERQLWMRARGEALNEVDLRACGLAYLSDFWLGGVAKAPHPEAVRQRIASLDHALWFHAPAQPTDWLLYEMSSAWAGSARGLAQGRIYDESGGLVASVAQEIYLFPGEMHAAPRVGEL
ncbi:acyl-CoA thioesterase domain-containing protein [Caulobacter sp. BK020]|uniref:acyl-CoA thioesterase n=1 Tax=Caulobacter sp. BK020 TaxID=2512117 RepID=UPI0010452BC2|nr:acyl-CoA thioesterase domain-containing protein [Caulobacter sp. BK020]TCS08094.1 acyl-CoA thioesterase-2 [Caulobacter sp. BK020]